MIIACSSNEDVSTTPVLETGALADFAEIFSEGTQAIVLRRPLTAALHDGVDALDLRTPLAFEATPKGWPGDLPGALAADLVAWMELLEELTGVSRFGVRIAAAMAPMCPNFHVDRINLRLVVAYRGPGTEVLVARRSTGAPLPSALGLPIVAASEGDAVLLKGEAFGDRFGGAIHRSPAHSGRRVVATVEPLG